MNALIESVNIFLVFPTPTNEGTTAEGVMNVATNMINNYAKLIGILLIIGSVIVIGYKFMLPKNAEERSKNMSGIMYLALGAIIIGSGLIITDILLDARQGLIEALKNSGGSGSLDFSGSSKIEKGKLDNFLTRALSVPFDVIVRMFIGGEGGNGLQSLLGFKSIDNLIFNGGDLTGLEPFTNSEWSVLNLLYLNIASLCSLLVLIMVMKTGIKFISGGTSVSKRMELQEDLMRWIFSILAIVIAPLFIQGIFYICGAMTQGLYHILKASPAYSNDGFTSWKIKGIIQNLSTGSVLTDGIVKVMFCYVDLKINILFMVRKIVITAMYAFTPIVAALWGINNKVNASAVWFGEMITNASMQFFYAFVFTVMLTALAPASLNDWFYSLLWMNALMSLADTLRNSLQGLFTKLSGFNEQGLSGIGVSALTSIIGGPKQAFTHSLNAHKVNDTGMGFSRTNKSTPQTTNTGNTNVGASTAASSPSASPGFGANALNLNKDTGSPTSSGAGATMASAMSSSNDLNPASASTGSDIFSGGETNLGTTMADGNASATESQMRDATSGMPTMSPQQQYAEKFEKQQKAFADNLNKLATSNKSHGQAWNKVGSILLSGDEGMNLAIGRRVSSVQRSFLAGKALYQTARNIALENNPDLKERLKHNKENKTWNPVTNAKRNMPIWSAANKELKTMLGKGGAFGSPSNSSSINPMNAAGISGLKILGAYGQGGKEMERYIAQKNPYASADSITWNS